MVSLRLEACFSSSVKCWIWPPPISLARPVARLALGDAAAVRRPELAVHGLHELAQAVARHAVVAEAGQQHHEFVVADPRQQVFGTQHALQAPGDRYQGLVAGVVAEHLVQALELVEVDRRDQGLRALAAPLFQALADGARQRLAVRQPGQLVVVEQELDLARGRAQFGIGGVQQHVRIHRLGRGGQLAVVDQLFDHAREVAQDVEFFAAQVARHGVEHAQGTDRHPVGRVQRHPGIEAHMGFAGYQRVVAKARVLGGVADHHRLVFEDGMAAERDVARGFGRFEAAARLEPLDVLVDQRHQGGRRAAMRVMRSKASSGALPSRRVACRAVRRRASSTGRSGICMVISC
jgi:hypothetical protein